MEDLQEKLLKSMKKFSSEMGGIKQEAFNSATSNMDGIDDPKMKAFLQESLNDAMNGTLSSDDLLNKFKDIQDGRG